MFVSKLDKKTLQEVNALLISGTSLKDVTELSGLSYPNVCYLRKKLVKAGVLQPLYKTTRKRTRVRTKTQTRTKRVSTPIVTNKSTYSMKLVVNGTPVDIHDAKSVNVSPVGIDIKY